MSIGINITDSVKVELLEVKEQLIKDLEEHGIKYEIPFDKTNTSGVKETLITMRDPDIEISVENDIINYIKTVNTEFSNLDKVENIDVNITEHIRRIQEMVNKKFNTKGCTIKIEKIDTKSLNITLIIHSNNNRARVQIIRDTFGDIYINTIRSI